MKKTSPLRRSHFALHFRAAVFSTALVTSLLVTPRAAHATRLSPASSGVIVAVIDTGADIYHQNLKGHLWRNLGELGYDSLHRDKSSNGIDDDGNGFIDDVNGWNFSDNDKNLHDEQGHGTHIAGIISGAPPAQVMVLKAFDAHRSGQEVLTATINAIHYAIRMHAQIINYSGGGSQPSPEEEAALGIAAKAGILVVAAAGNDRSDADRFGFYPAAYHLPNILSVAAVDQAGSLLPSSNYGVKTVKLAAPGQQILSTLPQNQYGMMTGTSQATASVTKTAVLLYAQEQKTDVLRSPSSMIDRMVSTADRVPELVGQLHNPVVLNTLRALRSSL